MNAISAISPNPAPGPAGVSPGADSDARLMRAARGFESVFVAEMLRSAGFGQARQAFGGGAGEEGFASFLLRAQADLIVQSGGFGLAERIYADLKRRGAGNG